MSQHSTGLSKYEKRPRLRGRPRGPTPKKEPVQPLQPLLYDRKTAAQLLSVSEAKLIAMEQAGTLQAVKLHSSENGKTYYRSEQVHTLAQEGVQHTVRRHGHVHEE
jgi:hypothetical protein